MLGGALACFAGYRLFRIVLGDLRLHPRRDDRQLDDGRRPTPSAWSSRRSSAAWSARSILVFAYFVGVALVGAGLGALARARRRGRSSAPAIRRRSLIVVASVVGAIGAMLLQRYVIIVGTAFGGAWTIIVGGVTSLAGRGGRAPRRRRRRGFSIRYAGAGRAVGAGRVGRARAGRHRGAAGQITGRKKTVDRNSDRNRIGEFDEQI